MSSPAAPITIQLLSTDLTYLNQIQQQIILVRSLQTESEYVVACAAFVPTFLTTTLQFGATWYVLAVPPPQAFGLITQQQSTTKQVSAGNVYTFAAGAFGQQEPAYSPSVFGCNNQVPNQPLGFGVAQNLALNNAAPQWAPLAIMTAPANQVSYLEPLDEVKIFLASNISSGEVLPASLLVPNGEAPVARRGSGFSVGVYLSVPLTQPATVYFTQATNSFTLIKPS